MSDSCLNCGGLIMEPNTTYGYAGKICYCPKVPTSIPVKTSESMAKETFEQRRDRLAHVALKKHDEFISVKELPERMKRMFFDGYDACREQMQGEIFDLKNEIGVLKTHNDNLQKLNTTVMDSRDECYEMLKAERAKAQKLVAALERISEWGWSEIEGHGRCHNLQGVHADEAIAEYESGKLLK